jgi:hypothetical protein
MENQRPLESPSDGPLDSISHGPVDSGSDGPRESTPHDRLGSIPDDDLLHRLFELMRRSRRVESSLVAHIGEVDGRRLYAREAAPSMFVYCTEVLHLSEPEAYLRIAAARASREHPILLAMLGDGRLHLTGIALLAPYLTTENRDTLLTRATHRSKRQIQELIVEIAPRPDVPALMRKLPDAPALMGKLPGLRPDGVAPSTGEARPEGAATLPPEQPVHEEQPQLRLDRVALVARAVPTPAVVQALAPGRYKV